MGIRLLVDSQQLSVDWFYRLTAAFPATANASFAAAIVCWMSSSVCAALKNAASNCDGGRYTPFSSMARKNLPNASVSDFAAESQPVTGQGAKNQVNIDPT